MLGKVVSSDVDLTTAPELVCSHARLKKAVKLDGLVTLIGSRKGSDVRIASPRASGAHAVLVNRGNVVYVRDLMSRGGVIVNGERLSQPRRLVSHDRLVI